MLVAASAEVLLELKGSRYYLNTCNTLSTPRWRDALEAGLDALSKKYIWFWIPTGKYVSSQVMKA